MEPKIMVAEVRSDEGLEGVFPSIESAERYANTLRTELGVRARVVDLRPCGAQKDGNICNEPKAAHDPAAHFVADRDGDVIASWPIAA